MVRMVASSCTWRRSFLGLMLCAVLATPVGCVAPAASPTPTPQPAFDLRQPPEGWYRTVDPLSGVVLWLPPDWEMFTTPEWADYSHETYYQPRDRSHGAAISVERILWVDFARNPDDPMITDGAHADSTYTMTVAGVALPCARYTYPMLPSRSFPSSVKHVCVVDSSRPDVAWALSFHMKATEEEALIPLWPPILTSFLLEEQPW